MALETELNETGGNRRGSERSPNYPSIGFKTSLEMTRKLYEAEKRNSMPRHLAAEHLGYASINGRSRMVLSALRKFGLIEPLPNEHIKISEDAYAIFVMPEEDPKRAEIVKKLALLPSIFQELLAEYSDGLPSEANLRTNLLLRRKFTESAADSFILAFKETMALIGGAPTQTKPPPEETRGGETSKNGGTSHNQSSDESRGAAVADLSKPLTVQRWSLGGGAHAELRVVGDVVPENPRQLSAMKMGFKLALLSIFEQDDAESQE